MSSLAVQAQSILDDFEHASPDEILDVINQIKPHFKNALIPEYLQGKVQKINNVGNNEEKKGQCKSLLPYLDWYLQGMNS